MGAANLHVLREFEDGRRASSGVVGHTMTPEEVAAWERDLLAAREQPSYLDYLRPGQPYRISELCELWGVSRGTARETAQQLRECGAVKPIYVTAKGARREMVGIVRPAGQNDHPLTESEADITAELEALYVERYGEAARR